MFPNPSNGISLLKIIGGISKSLSIAGELIPLYQQAKPMVQNARNAFSTLKQINNKVNNIPTKTPVNINLDTPKQNKKVVTNSNNFNNPTFFK